MTNSDQENIERKLNHVLDMGKRIIELYPHITCTERAALLLAMTAAVAWLLMAGSTNHMQSHIANGIVVAKYKDGTADTLQLVNPDNWCPIEQDYYVDDKAFSTTQPRPYRVSLETGKVSRDLGRLLNIQGVYGREIPGGAATNASHAPQPQEEAP